MSKRIVITGMGAVTPLGIGVDQYWDGLIAGKSGIAPIRSFDASELPVRFAGEVKDYRPEDHLPRKLIKNTDVYIQYAYTAAKEAIEDSGLAIEPDRTGIVVGTAMGGVSAIAGMQNELSLSGTARVGPRFIPKILGNLAASDVAIEYGIQGPTLTVSTACASGGDAIHTACMCIRAGMADSMVVIGADAVLCPLIIEALAAVKALSRRNETPSSACRPFDATRDGFVIGEGGGSLILETEEHAVARGAEIYGEIRGCGITNDAYHVMAPHPDGRGAIACMEKALESARLDPSEIGYINAHGTATPKGDAVEAEAIRSVFRGRTPYVSSTKGATGHMMGAGGITEVIACVQAIRTGTLPPTVNLTQPAPECGGVRFVANAAEKAEIQYAMSNAFGFGGQNSSIIIGKYAGQGRAPARQAACTRSFLSAPAAKRSAG